MNLIQQSIKNIFTSNLKVKQSEKVLVFSDTHNRKIQKLAKQVANSGKHFSTHIIYTDIQPTESHGTEPPEKLWTLAFGEEAIIELKQRKVLTPIIMKRASHKQMMCAEKVIRDHKKASVNVVIALSYFSTSHTRFRDFLTRICKARYASMPLFDEQMLVGAMRVNWERMKKRTEKMKKIISRFEMIEINTPNGSFISLSKKGRKVMADTGIITRPGAFSNLPAGEVFLAPCEGSAHGMLVLEWAPTRKLKKPVLLSIEKGMVKNIEGEKVFSTYLEKKLEENPANRNIAELGIGTNEKASRPDNILESEKILGTIHIALGDNSSFGGRVRTPFHQDFVFFHPTVILKDHRGKKRTLMRDGKLCSL